MKNEFENKICCPKYVYWKLEGMRFDENRIRVKRG